MLVGVAQGFEVDGAFAFDLQRVAAGQADLHAGDTDSLQLGHDAEQIGFQA